MKMVMIFPKNLVEIFRKTFIIEAQRVRNYVNVFWNDYADKENPVRRNSFRNNERRYVGQAFTDLASKKMTMTGKIFTI